MVLTQGTEGAMSGDILECHESGDGYQQPGAQLSTLQSQDSPHSRYELPRTWAVPKLRSLTEPPTSPRMLSAAGGSLLRMDRQPVSLGDGSSKMHPCFLRTDLKLLRGNFQKNKSEDVLLNYMKPVTASLT